MLLYLHSIPLCKGKRIASRFLKALKDSVFGTGFIVKVKAVLLVVGFFVLNMMKTFTINIHMNFFFIFLNSHLLCLENKG